MKEITYRDILSRYPILAQDMPIDALVRLAYMAGRLDRMTEEIEKDQELLAKKEIAARAEIRTNRNIDRPAADQERENLARKKEQ